MQDYLERNQWEQVTEKKRIWRGEENGNILHKYI
jgi:hypothetical protein